MVKVAFTGSFDPPHIGHKHVVEIAQSLGSEIVIFVANNVNKTYAKNLEMRTEDATKFFNDCKVVAADADNIGNIIKSEGCIAIIRGLRDTKDFEYEQTISDFNRTVNGLNTIYIPCPEEYRGVSSTKLRLTPHPQLSIMFKLNWRTS